MKQLVLCEYVTACLNGIFARFDGAGATYYGKNAHGDVIYTQNNLTVTKHYDYDPFGNEINPDETDTNPFRYCGEYFDVHSGTYYLRNRYYYPRLGRFTTIDPARDGHNWYVYCSNNPLVFVDPFGLGEVMARYIAEKNGGMVTWNEDTRTVSITMPGFDTVEAKGRIVNGRMLVEDTWFMNTFGLSKEEATHQEGDVFYTSDDAALAFALMYYDTSKEERIEYGAAIDQRVYDGKTVYQLGKVTTSVHSAKIKTDITEEERHAVNIWRNDFSYADIHTHWDPNGKPSFSETDYNLFNKLSTKIMYVVTPDGTLMKCIRNIRKNGYRVLNFTNING